MSASTKLSVSETLGTTFSFSWKNYIPLTVIYLALTALILGPIMYLAFNMFPEFFINPIAAIEELLQTEPEIWEQTAAFGQFNALSNLMQVGSWLVSAIFAVTIINTLAFGKSVWRPAIGMNVLRYIVGIIVLILIVILTLILAGLFGYLIFRLGGLFADRDASEGLFIFAAILGGVIPFIYVVTRASLIPVDMVYASKIRVVEGWSISAGNVGRIFLSYFCTWLIALVIMMFAMGLAAALLFGAGLGDVINTLSEQTEPEAALVLSELKALFLSPLGISAIVVYLAAVIYASILQAALPAAAYVGLTKLDRSHLEPDEAEATLA
ncbi:MAG: hypothetical protein EP340_01310 [Alphaproteobacteria bacterium]|nr:MAG: hypothetical protein EP340_01310 [Alphaproteobacteria bacterium]